uniref:Uncharacterized protein n=1 Tax=Rhizophora mucronata TaxID=61149 RepID=A0A2P2QKQ8_RHIMU
MYFYMLFLVECFDSDKFCFLGWFLCKFCEMGLFC